MLHCGAERIAGLVMSREREKEISIRLVWPFARITATSAETIGMLARMGVPASAFANPDTRFPYRLAMRMLENSVKITGDQALGLHAGEQIEPGDFDVLEYVARSAANLREAIAVMARYFRLLNDAAEISLADDGPNAALCFRLADDEPSPPALNDFMLAAAVAFSKRNTVYEPPIEVRVMHARPSYAAEYERIFQAQVRFGAPCNALIVQRSRLSAPMLRANPRIGAAFELHAQQLLDRLREGDGITGRVRDTIASRLATGDVNMVSTARKLGMSVATLRRRLEVEGTSFADIVDDLRRKLAERHLRETTPAVSEIALLLGFSNVTAFHRAFRRWTGIAPTEFRARARGA